MYPIVLALAMSSGADVPQGVLPSGGCSGTRTPVRTTLAVVGNRLRTPLLPQFYARPLASSRTVAGSAGCSGGVAAGYSRLPVANGPSIAVPPEVGGPISSRIALQRALHKALVEQNVPVARRVAVRRVLADRDMFEDLTTEVRRMTASAAKSQGQSVGAWGDGKWLQVIIDNLPAILDAIERIIKLFS